VRLRADAAGAGLHPLGRIGLVQTVAPLDVPLQRFGASPIEGPNTVTVAAHATSGGAALGTTTVGRDRFATAQYFDVSDDDRLGQPSFADYDAGVVLAGTAWTHGPALTSDVVYEECLGDEPRGGLRNVHGFDIGAWVVVGAAARAGLAGQVVTAVKPPVLTVDVVEPTYVLVDATTLDPVAGGTGVPFSAVRAMSASVGAGRLFVEAQEVRS